MLLCSALNPVAVFCAPIVLLESAESPLAVLKLPVGVAKEGECSISRVVGASSVA